MLPIQQGNFSRFKTSVIELKGGMNENVSSLELAGGELIDCKNYMMAEGGYGGYLSVPGYERFDGTTLPSKYESLVLTLKSCPAEILSGQTVSGDISLATAIALEDGQIVSGSYLESDAIVKIQCRILTGTFDLLEAVSTTVSVGIVDSAIIIQGGDNTFHLGLDYSRTIVTEVPGEGPILGLDIFEDKVYVFRKKVSLAQIGMYVENVGAQWLEIDTSANPITYTGSHSFIFKHYNFYAQSNTYSMFFIDGTNQARMYDGTTVTTIVNGGMAGADAPINLATHNFHLFLAYAGGSLQHSALGEPTTWDAVLGASEIGIGAEITNLVAGVQSSLIVYVEDGVRILKGTSVDDWVLQVFSDTSGAYYQTAKRLLGTIYSVGDRGLSTLDAIDTYGDYAANSISQKFKKTLFANKSTITQVLVNRDLNQYRVFFENNKGIYISFQGKELQGATFVEFPIEVSVAAQGDDEDKNELLVFSSGDTGYVYKMDSGFSFDDLPIITRVSTAFFHYGSPRRNKTFKRATLEIKADTNQSFNVKVDFDYNEIGKPRTIWYEPTVYSASGDSIYSESLWGSMVYGGTSVTDRVPIYIIGIGTNMSYKIISNEMYRPQHIIQNIITDFSLNGRRI